MWGKIADNFFGHPKVLQTSLAARGLWVTCASWSSKYDTDGYVPDNMVRSFGGNATLRRSLLEAGLWENADGGIQFHDWHDYNPTPERRAQVRSAAAERMRQLRHDKKGHR